MKWTVVTSTLFAAVPLMVMAQVFDTSLFGSSLSIGLYPQYPQPGEQVRLVAHARGIDIENSTIVWRTDTKAIAQGKGVDTIDITAPSLGQEFPIELDVMEPDGAMHAAQAVIAPAAIDLLVSADSYTPPFYRGRALPSAGTDLIAQAIAHFVRDGVVVPDSSITYTWKKNGQVLGSMSGRGRSSAVIPIQHLYTVDTITIHAVSSDGTREAETSIRVPSRSPTLDLYEDHPLYGTLYHAALPASASVVENEMSFAAVPYFAQVRHASDPLLSYVWRVNGALVPSSTTTPSKLTINAGGVPENALIELEATHNTNVYMDAIGTWNVSFTPRGRAQDAFRTAK